MTYDCAAVLQTLIVLSVIQTVLVTGLLIFTAFRETVVYLPSPSDGGV